MKRAIISYIYPVFNDRIFCLGLILNLLFTSALFAQSNRIYGVVTNDERDLISDVVVELIPANRFTTTDHKGNFYFNEILPGEYLLKFSHIAYTKQEMPLNLSLKKIPKLQIRLKSAETILDEIVLVNSYSEVNKEIISRQEIKNSSAAGAEDLLKNLGGLQVFRTDGTSSKLSIRGSSSKEIKVLLDGVTLNSAMDGSFDLNSIPKEMIEKIEVYKQGNSELSGQGTGGVINIITKKNPLLRQQELNLRLSGNGFYSNRDEISLARLNNYDLALDNSFNLLNHAITISSTYRDMPNEWSYINASKYDAYRFLNAPNTPFTRENNYSESGSFFSAISSTNDFFGYNYIFNYNQSKNGLPGYIDGLLSKSNITDFGRKHRLELNSKLLSFKFNLNSYYDNGTKIIDMPEPPSFTHSTDRYQNRGFDFKAECDFYQTTIKEGFSYNYEELTAQNLTNKVNKRENKSIFLSLLREDSLTNMANLLLSTQTSGRYEFIEQEEEAKPFYSAKVGLEKEFGYLNLNLGAGYNETYNLPTFADLFWADNLFSTGNPKLKPEYAISRFVALAFSGKINEDDDLSFSGSVEYFNRNIRNLIIWTKDYTGKYKPKNSLGGYFSGFEYQLQLSLFQELLTLEGLYQELDSENHTNKASTDKKELIYKPQNSLNLKFGSKWQDLSIKFGADRNGKMYQNEVNSQEVDPFWLFSLRLAHEYKITPKLKLNSSLDLENLLDEQYQLIYAYPMAGRSVKTAFTLTYQY